MNSGESAGLTKLSEWAIFFAISRGTFSKACSGAAVAAAGEVHGPTRHDEIELAEAILTGIERRPTQSFGSYFGPNGGSCALGARTKASTCCRPTRTTPCHGVSIGSSIAWRTRRAVTGGLQEADSDRRVIVHLNDDHEWTREMVAAWLREIQSRRVKSWPDG